MSQAKSKMKPKFAVPVHHDLHVMDESALKRLSEWRNQGYVTTNKSID